MDNFMGKLKKAADQAADMVGDAYDAGKLKLKVETETKELKKAYAELGKLYYEKAKDTELPDDVKDIVATVTDKLKVLDELKAQIEKAKED